jgi:hypothetical protein
LVFALSAFAGDISTTVVSTPPPPTEQAMTQGDISTTVAGDITTGVTAIDPAMEVMLSLLQSLLSLF